MKMKTIKLEIKIPEDFDAGDFVQSLMDDFFYANRETEWRDVLDNITFAFSTEEN